SSSGGGGGAFGSGSGGIGGRSGTGGMGGNGACASSGVASCDDSDACSQTDVCQNGQRVGKNRVVRPPVPQCQLGGVCNPITGKCPTMNAPDNTPCGAGPMCLGTSLVGQSSCRGGICMTPAAAPCPGGFPCSLGACKTSCITSNDCLTTHFC